MQSEYQEPHPFYKLYSKEDLMRALTRILEKFHFEGEPFASRVTDNYVRNNDLRASCHVAAVIAFRDWGEGILVEECKLLRDALWDLAQGGFHFDNSDSKRRRNI